MFSLFQYGFMQRAFWAAISMSILASILGTFLILRRQTFMSDTLSHVSLSGIAIALVLGISQTFSTIFIVLVAAIFLEYFRTIHKDFLEIGIAIIMSTGLAVALIVMNQWSSVSTVNLDQYLFGSIVTISQTQAIILMIIAIIVFMLTVLFIRPMYILTFDEDTAFVDGLPVRTISIFFNIVTGVAIALMIPAVGALMVSTIMVLPASISLKIGKSFKSVLLIAHLIGFVGMISGLSLSYYLGTPVSASITVIFVVLFLLVSFVNRQ